MKNKTALIKIKKIAGTIILIALCLIIALVMLTSIINRAKNKPTFIFGRSFLWVSTGSMQPAIEARSYIMIKAYGGEDLSEGEIITFVCTDKSSAVYGSLITHRIIEVLPEGYITKGDYSAGPDKQTVFKQDIAGVYVKKLSVLTFFGRLYASPAGLVALIAVFLGACAFVYVPDIISALKEDKFAQEKQKIIDEKVRQEVEKLKAGGAVLTDEIKTEEAAAKTEEETKAAENKAENAGIKTEIKVETDKAGATAEKSKPGGRKQKRRKTRKG